MKKTVTGLKHSEPSRWFLSRHSQAHTKSPVGRRQWQFPHTESDLPCCCSTRALLRSLKMFDQLCVLQKPQSRRDARHLRRWGKNFPLLSCWKWGNIILLNGERGSWLLLWRQCKVLSRLFLAAHQEKQRNKPTTLRRKYQRLTPLPSGFVRQPRCPLPSADGRSLPSTQPTARTSTSSSKFQ